MQYVGLFCVAPFWGFFSPKLFLKSWLSFLGIIACLIGLFRGTSSGRFFFKRLYTNVTEMLFAFGLLMSGFYILYFELPFGKSNSEVLIYWIFTTIQMAIILPSLSKRVDDVWNSSAASTPNDVNE